MPKLRPITIAVLNLMAVGLGLILIGPQRPLFAGPNSLAEVRSMAELLQWRDRLIAKIESPQSLPFFVSDINHTETTELITELQIVERRILDEKKAEDNWQQALRLADGADALSESASHQDHEEALFLWEQAIENLLDIPDHSFLASSVAPKVRNYQRQIAALEQGNFDQMALTIADDTNYLQTIARESGLAKQVRITVCSLERKCVNFRGDRPPSSPASLIKVPIAVAAMQKAQDDKISLDTKILVKRGNFTEDASSISTRVKYPLSELIGQMIDHSSNIATNELIDYLGWDYINKTLKKQGYRNINVKFKLMGNRVMPAKPGKGKNTITSNELTEMMVRIYNKEVPYSDQLIAALARQNDRLLGYQALAKSSSQWLGEKTGENSKVLGTTLAMKINEKIYILTVINPRSGTDPIIRKAIRKIADRIAEKGL